MRAALRWPRLNEPMMKDPAWMIEPGELPENFAARVAELDDAALYRAASLVFGGGVPNSKISLWAMHLVWAWSHRADEHRVTNPYRKLAELRDSSATSACGYVFKHGDIAWSCRTCE